MYLASQVHWTSAPTFGTKFGLMLWDLRRSCVQKVVADDPQPGSGVLVNIFNKLLGCLKIQSAVFSGLRVHAKLQWEIRL